MQWLLYIYSLWFPVSWIQDIHIKNNGYDLLSLKKQQGYFTGTYKQRQQFLTHLTNGEK